MASTDSPDKQVNWPWFIIGCIFLLAALVAFFWGFSFEYLSPSRRFLLMWLLPLASGFGCGCFAGSLNLSGPIGSLAVAATGGFAVWLLSFYLLPKIPDPAPQPIISPTAISTEELKKLLGDRYAKLRQILDAEAPKTSDKPAYDALRTKIEIYLKKLEKAIAEQNMILVHDTTKDLLDLLGSGESKKILSPEAIVGARHECNFPNPLVTPIPQG
jgi:hypothetical protein